MLTFARLIVGRTWTGFDLSKGLVMSRVLRSLDIGARVHVARRLTPATFFILPSGTTIAARIYLTPHDRLDVLRTWAAAPTELLSLSVRDHER
ncbi:MAG: hypothetical protein ACHQ0J_13055 [Candidatus Dormibacterales bacterium]